MLILERFAYTPFGTFGRLYGAGMTVYTVERPWLDDEPNKPGECCVPRGTYQLDPHSSSRFPDTWALVGETVSHYAEPGKARSAILFHVGNTMDDLRGCIAPGESLGYLNQKWGVLDSKAAMNRFRGMVRQDGSYSIDIVNYEGGRYGRA